MAAIILNENSQKMMQSVQAISIKQALLSFALPTKKCYVILIKYLKKYLMQ